MKTVLIIFFCLSITLINSQEMDFEKKISDLFFGLDLNREPKKIVKQSNFKFDSSISIDAGGEFYNYWASFKNYSIIKAKINQGYFRIEHSDEESKYGIQQLIISIDFENEYDQIDYYNQLVYDFKDYSSKTIIETTENKDFETKSQVVVYQKDKNFEIPQLSFYFDQSEKNKFPLLITYKYSFKPEKLEKFKKSND